MKRALAFAVLLCGPALAAGPEDWAGSWKGECKISPAFEGVERFPVSLTIGPPSSSGALRWRIHYETGGQGVRDYELQPAGDVGRYVLDEKNGLKLDATFMDGTLYSTFSIGTMLIVAQYSVGPDGAMTMALPSFEVTPSRTSCLTEAPETCAAAFALKGTQTCRLTKIEMRKLP